MSSPDASDADRATPDRAAPATDPVWPPEDVVQRVHGRYQVEIVEGLNLCPFARKSRELGRVHRPVFRFDAAAQVERSGERAAEVARALADLVEAHPDAEIVLLTFPVRRAHPWSTPQAFERFLPPLREAYAALPGAPVFYMVAFHPGNRLAEGAALTRDNLVPLIRRSPDPVIQCVRAETLDAVRRQAQQVAHARMRAELLAINPDLAEMLDRSIAPDPELSQDIARANFDAVGAGPEREAFETRIADILRERDELYAET